MGEIMKKQYYKWDELLKHIDETFTILYQKRMIKYGLIDPDTIKGENENGQKTLEHKTDKENKRNV